VWYVLCLLRCAMCLVFYVVCLLWFFKWPCHWQFYSPYIHQQYTNILIVKVYGPVLARREGRRCVLNGLVTGSSPRSLFPRRNPWRACERLCLSVPSLSLHRWLLRSPSLPLSLSPSLPLSLSPSLPSFVRITQRRPRRRYCLRSPRHTVRVGEGEGKADREAGTTFFFLLLSHVYTWVCGYVCVACIYSLLAPSLRKILSVDACAPLQMGPHVCSSLERERER